MLDGVVRLKLIRDARMDRNRIFQDMMREHAGEDPHERAAQRVKEDLKDEGIFILHIQFEFCVFFKFECMFKMCL